MFRKVAREELKVPGRIEYLADLRDFVTRVGKKYGFSERVINAFKLSIDEAATNIIKHAYRDWSGDITLRAVAKKNSLTMVLIDQGKFFDPRQVGEPDLQRYVEIGKKGGLGIFIMRRLLDEIDYRKSEEGNELWMVKHRDEVRRPKIAIPLTLKMRYWLYSLAIFTSVLLIVTIFNYFQNKHRILEDAIMRGRSACSFLSGQVRSNWSQIDPEVINELVAVGSYDVELRAGADEGIRTLVNSEHLKDVKEVFLTDRRSIILASSDTNRTVWEDTFTLPAEAQIIRRYQDSIVHLIDDGKGSPVLNISWPIISDDGRRLADVQLQIDYRTVTKEIAQYTLALATEAFFIWLVVSAGLFVLIYLVMNPFKRLQDWVKRLNEPGAAEEMDIDTSSEIGAIAQAFSDITIQLRKSQAHLVEQERLQQEMHIAKQIQQTLLPSEFPEIEGYEIGSYYAAAKEVGGDFYDFVEVDKDTLGVAVADVSGKGVPGAFVMTMIRTALRSEARGVKDAAEVLAKVNDFVVNDMKKGMFVTLLYVIIDSKRRRINFASAGHNPLILHRPSRGKTYYLNPRGFPIGISLPDKDLFRRSIESDTISLAEDDIIIIYTDGVTEAMNPRRRLFGEERFLRVIREYGRRSAQEFIESLKHELNTFTEGNEQNDDITLVAIKEKLSAEQVEFRRAVQVFQMVQKGIGIKEACRQAGISTYAYYQKYKEKFEKEGVENFVFEPAEDQIEAMHLSIEEKNKIYDVIRRHPEYGAKRISEELNTERYGFTQIPASRIYEELVRMRLNTKELRQAFVQRGGKRRRIKPPGTPLLTVDGRVIINREQVEEFEEEEEPKPAVETAQVVEEKPIAAQVVQPTEEEVEQKSVFDMDTTVLLTKPLEEVLDKRGTAAGEEPPSGIEELLEFEEPAASFAVPPVEDSPKEPTSADEPRLTVVDAEQLDAVSARDAESEQQLKDEEKLFFDSADEIELLASLQVSEEWSEEPPSIFETEISPDDGSSGPEEPAEEEFDWPTLEEYQAAQEAGKELKLPDEAAAVDQDVDQKKTAFKDLLPEDDLFRAWAAESRTVPLPFAEDEESTNPFEELLELDGEETWEEMEEDIELDISELLIEAKETFSEPSTDEGGAEESYDSVEAGEEEKEIVVIDASPETAADADLGLDDGEFDRLLQEAVSVPPSTVLQSILEKQSAPEAPQESETFYDRALQLYQRGRYQEAIQALGTMPERFPRDAKLQLLLGNALFRSRRYTEAAQAFERVIEVEPTNETACENLAAAYANCGRLKNAVHLWEYLKSKHPERREIAVRIAKARLFLDKMPL